MEVFDLSLTISFISRALESYYWCAGTNIHIQNTGKNSKCWQMIMHIIPRKSNEGKKSEGFYGQIEKYPDDLLNHYNEKMNFYVNAYANKILEGIHEQSKKY